ncbi:MAG: 4Fe-4S binding protein [Dehalococcoidia bacterium]|nr:MAG: 4Fe-4S binding protein [Dehalococcoidia bacterium]
MCEFCIQHGEGKKWYLTMRNYSRELWEQCNRAEYMEDFGAQFEVRCGTAVAKLDAVKSIPVVYRFFRRMAMHKNKTLHWGQIVPIEDVEQILEMQDSIVRMPCVCRRLTTGRETRYCFGVGMDIMGMFGKYPDYSHGLEVLEKEEAVGLVRSFDKQGLVHSIWTFRTPYIGAVCNCDQDCMAYGIQFKTNLTQIMFRAEYVATVDWNKCNGCKKCLLNCQFGAIGYSNTMKRPTIDMNRCYGCGVCRSVCDKEAIALLDRAQFATLPW